jgi:hypothetical protein
VKHEKKQRQNRKAGKDVGQQHADEPRQRRGQRQRESQCHKPPWLGHPEHPQRQVQDPHRGQYLDPEVEPEVAVFAEMEVKPKYGRTAGDQIALVPPRQIAAGIRLEQRIAVPERGREQH